MGKKG